LAFFEDFFADEDLMNFGANPDPTAADLLALAGVSDTTPPHDSPPSDAPLPTYQPATHPATLPPSAPLQAGIIPAEYAPMGAMGKHIFDAWGHNQSTGNFCPKIDSNFSHVRVRNIMSTVAYAIYQFKQGTPTTTCEMLVRDVNHSSSFPFQRALTWGKFYADFDSEINATEVSHEDKVAFAQSCIAELVQMLAPYTNGTLTPDKVMLATRHRQKNNNKKAGVYKLSVRLFVLGYRCTLSTMYDIVKRHKQQHPQSHMDESVYSSNRKMSMVFCIKSMKEKHPLLPGNSALEADSLMFLPTGLPNPSFNPLNYIIQYTQPSDTLITFNQPPILNYTVPVPTPQQPVPATANNNTTPRTSHHSAALLSILEHCGFTNVRLVGQPSSAYGMQHFNFDCDNRTNCLMCGNTHDNNMFKIGVGPIINISNHSTSCKSFELSKFRPMSKLAMDIFAHNDFVHEDFANAFISEVGQHVVMDEAQDTVMLFSETAGKYEALSGTRLQGFVASKLKNVLKIEQANIEHLIPSVRVANARVTLEELDKQLKLIKKAMCRIGSYEFQRSVTSAVKVQFVSSMSHQPVTFDSNINMFHFPNGALDLETGVFGPTLPSHLNSNVAGCDYEQEGWVEEYPKVVDMIEAVCPDPVKRKLLQAVCGYILTGRTDLKKLIVFTDLHKGSNGKTFIAFMLLHMMGDYADKCQRNILCVNKSAGESASPFMIKLKGKRYAVFEEAGNRPLDTNFIKDITNGTNNNTFVARALYKSAESFPLRAKFLLTCNKGHLKFDTNDGAFVNRLLIFSFDVTFTHDPTEVNEPMVKLANVSEVDRLFNSRAARYAFFKWCYDGLALCTDNLSIFDDNALPLDMLEFKKKVVMINDPLHPILQSLLTCTGNPKHSVQALQVWTAYRNQIRGPCVKEIDFLLKLRLFVENEKEGAWQQTGSATGSAVIPSITATIKYFSFRAMCIQV
jgi:phage/plasmid-associated DNA primase